MGYGGGDIDKCTESNQYRYVCEPASEGTTLKDFSIFPEPKGQPTWEKAKQFVAQGAGDPTPIWDEDMVPGSSFTDPKTGLSSTVPGSNLFVQAGRNPYQDFVSLAADLGVTGVDLDYEEMWHADYHKTNATGGSPQGPWELDQTVYKYAAILKDIRSNIEAIKPSLKV